MHIQLSADQTAAVDHILDWFDSPTADQLTLGGYAGTGKTTILAAVAEALSDFRLQFVSLTGKAVNVMAEKLPDQYTSTMHSFLYQPIIAKGEVIGWHKKHMVEPDQRAHEGEIPHVDLIINDEASMTDSDLYRDLMAHGRPVLFVGDHGQLPPVGRDFNLMQSPDIRLEEIHRQARDNPILIVAEKARTLGRLHRKKYTDLVQVIDPDNLPNRVANILITPSPDTMVIAATNQQRVSVNTSILTRQGRKPRAQEIPQPGDRIICLKNHKQSGLYNGALCTLEEVFDSGQHSFEATVLPDGSPNPVHITIARYAFNEPKPEYPGLHIPGLPFDYGYCLTCHKAQGSEAKRVIVMGQGFGNADLRRRWLYTAVTRAQEELYVLQ